MTCVGEEVGISLDLGDWYVAQQLKKPDVTIWGGYFRFTIAFCLPVNRSTTPTLSVSSFMSSFHGFALTV